MINCWRKKKFIYFYSWVIINKILIANTIVSTYRVNTIISSSYIFSWRKKKKWKINKRNVISSFRETNKKNVNYKLAKKVNNILIIFFSTWFYWQFSFSMIANQFDFSFSFLQLKNANYYYLFFFSSILLLLKWYI